MRRIRESPSLTSEDVKSDSKPSQINPIGVCFVVTLVCVIVYSIPYYTSPHHSWEVDILGGVETTTRQYEQNSIRNRELFKNQKKHMNSEDHPSWLIDELEHSYKLAQHKAAITSMEKNDGTRNVWDLFEASWSCLTKQRIGKVGDGGKWICDSHRLKMKNKQCVIYSFGSAGETSFEDDAYDQFGCEIHSFDPTLEKSIEQLMKSKKSFKFHPWGLKAHNRIIHPHQQGESRSRREDQHDDLKYKSLRNIMKILGHDYIDVLKVDVEGSEWSIFNDDILCNVGQHRLNQDIVAGNVKKNDDDDPRINVFDNHYQEELHMPENSLPFGQLSVEFHWSGAQYSPDVGEKDLFDFMRGMHSHGFKIFNREPNALAVQHCWEYSFVKTSTSDATSYLADCAQNFDTRHQKAMEWFHSQ